jgi:outer membrane murein-binding lipoprotein Lpp
MNKSASNAFINQLLVYSLVMLVFTGSIGFGTVWLRHEISLAANRNKTLQAQIDEVQRRLDQVSSEIAAAQTPDALIRLDESLRLGLDTPRQEQIEYVAANVEQRLVTRRGAGVFIAEVQPAAMRRGGTR